MSETLPPSRGRGRPRAEHPLTNAERQRRYRERQKNADKPENPQTLQRFSQLHERIDRMENRHIDQFTRIEKRQNELEHRLKSLQTLLTRVVNRLDMAPAGAHSGSSARLSGNKAGARKKLDAGITFIEETKPIALELNLLADTNSVDNDTGSSIAQSVEDVFESKPEPYYLSGGHRCQIATGREGGQCGGKMSHTVKLTLPDGTWGEFGVCQIHFRQAQQRRILTPLIPTTDAPTDPAPSE
ncbi:MAG: hypothetical protein ACR2HF_05200 [Methylococcaceae bacterium]